MDYSEVKRHIISKKYFLLYGIIIFISLILGYLAFINKNNIVISFSRGSIFAVAVFFSSILSIRSMLINLYRCRSFNNFLTTNDLVRKTMQLCRITVEKEGYTMKGVNQSHDAKIHPMPKQTNVIYSETDDFILIFFSIQHFGIFQEVLKPLIFLKTDKVFFLNDKNVKVIRNFETFDTEQGRNIIFSNRYGIKKVIIPLQIRSHSLNQTK